MMFLGTFKKFDDVNFAVAVDPDKRLVASSFARDAKASRRHLERYVKSRLHWTSPDKISDIVDSLHRLYQGLDPASPVSFRLMGTSQLQDKIYSLTRSIPKERVSTYGKIAEMIGDRNLARAVGQAMARNPLCLVVPCHRILPFDLRIGAYSAGGEDPWKGGPVKKGLLEREGVKFVGDRVSSECLWP